MNLDDFKKYVRGRFDSLDRDLQLGEEPPQNTLYHYTNAPGLIGTMPLRRTLVLRFGSRITWPADGSTSRRCDLRLAHTSDNSFPHLIALS